MSLIEVRPMFLEEVAVDSPRRGPGFNLLRALLILLLPDGDECYTPKDVVEYHFRDEPERSEINRNIDALRKAAERKLNKEIELGIEQASSTIMWSKTRWIEMLPPEVVNKLVSIDQAIQEAITGSPEGTKVFLNTETFELETVLHAVTQEPSKEMDEPTLQVSSNFESKKNVVREPIAAQIDKASCRHHEPIVQAPIEENRKRSMHYQLELCFIFLFLVLIPLLAPRNKDQPRQLMNDYLNVYGLSEKLQPSPPKGKHSLTEYWKNSSPSPETSNSQQDQESFL